MASEHKQLLTIVYISVGLIAAGTWWDLRWHAAHTGTTGADLAAAHGLLWLGVGVAIVVGARGRMTFSGRSQRGYRILFAIASLYALAEAAHFLAHSLGSESPALHLALGIGKLALVAGAASAVRVSRRRLRQHSQASSPSGSRSDSVEGRQPTASL